MSSALRSGGNCARCGMFIPSGGAVEWFRDQAGKNRFVHTPACPGQPAVAVPAGASAPPPLPSGPAYAPAPPPSVGIAGAPLVGTTVLKKVFLKATYTASVSHADGAVDACEIAATEEWDGEISALQRSDHHAALARRVRELAEQAVGGGDVQ